MLFFSSWANLKMAILQHSNILKFLCSYFSIELNATASKSFTLHFLAQ